MLQLAFKTCCLCNARLAGVLAKCLALAHLNLTYNAIAPGCTCGMKRKMCTISSDLQHRIEVLKSIMERIQLAKDSKDHLRRYPLLSGTARMRPDHEDDGWMIVKSKSRLKDPHIVPDDALARA